MAKLIVQHRRGTQAEWESKPDIIPLEGELIIVIDVEHKEHKLKIGDGQTKYSDLNFLTAGSEDVVQVLKPKAFEVILSPNWHVDENGRVYQEVEVDENIINKMSATSRLDLQPSADQIVDFKNQKIAFSTENHISEENPNGKFYIYSLADTPARELKIQATIVEVDTERSVITGIPVTFPSYDNSVSKIVEEAGTGNGWIYRKWSSGKCELSILYNVLDNETQNGKISVAQTPFVVKEAIPFVSITKGNITSEYYVECEEDLQNNTTRITISCGDNTIKQISIKLEGLWDQGR